ncbi:carboxylesterase [Nemania sp. FL0916]|nr:carboxylesterase [Nemania sp. FL0916]
MRTKSFLGVFTAFAAFSIKSSSCVGDKDARLTVDTSTGSYTGLQEPDHEEVRVFRNIPYAEPPVGKLRWKPPISRQASRLHHYSYRFPPPCPQYLTTTLSLWNSNMTNFSISPGGQSYSAGEMAQTTGEDCLSLAVWTPINATDRDKLPVGLFVPGGSFKNGGLSVPYHNPSGWIGRSQKHIMVMINYRLNIFGFPNSPGLETQNLGVLDQRLALEWVYQNIAAFGGDPKRITLWGHSAGALAVDILNFAYPDDPLAAAFFLMSGTAMRKFAQGDNALQTNFSFVAKKLGCDFPQDVEAELECMQQVPATLVSNFYGQYGDNDTEPSLFFRPTADSKTIFKNYTERAAKGLISQVPALVSTTFNEQSSLTEYPLSNLVAGPNQTKVDKGTLSDFVCPAYNTTNVRADNNLTTYRYQYVGNYSNITPYPWMGAFHGSDLPMIFGTYNLSGGATDIQKQVAERMQDYVFAFLADPHDGLAKLGWLPSSGSKSRDATMVQLGDTKSMIKNISSNEVDGACMR